MAVQPETHVGGGTTPRRPRGRPRRVIEREALLDVVEALLRDGGIESVSIERAAAELGVSRATLYRSVPSREQLLGMLLGRMTDELTAAALVATEPDGRSASERLYALIRVHIDAAIRMRDYLFLFFGREFVSGEAYEAWRKWSREFEQIWVYAVRAAAEEGTLQIEDPVVATRLLLGMLVWISRWYRPGGRIDAEALTAEAIRLIGGTPR